MAEKKKLEDLPHGKVAEAFNKSAAKPTLTQEFNKAAQAGRQARQMGVQGNSGGLAPAPTLDNGPKPPPQARQPVIRQTFNQRMQNEIDAAKKRQAELSGKGQQNVIQSKLSPAAQRLRDRMRENARKDQGRDR
jgi:hypothetical protein